MRRQLVAGLRTFAALADEYDLDVLLGDRGSDSATRERMDAADQRESFADATDLRTPELPCLQAYREGWKAVQSLALPLFSNTAPALRQIKTSWQHHPEALMPVVAASLLEKRQPRQGSKNLPLLSAQAELFEMGAASPSVLPRLHRYARFRAATARLELAGHESTDSDASRVACLQHIGQALASEPITASESFAYFEMAFALGAFDLSREWLVRGERLTSADERALRSRIRLEIAAGSLASALRLLDQILVANPEEPWALEQKKQTKTLIEVLVDKTR